MKPHNALLTQARKERGWSQKDVAEKIGTLANTVSRWERGEVMPTPYYQQKLCDLFAKTPQELGMLHNEEDGRDQQMETSRQTGQEPADEQVREQRPPFLQNRTRMLERLHHSYSDLMSQSLQGAVWLELGMASKPDVVKNAANLLLRVRSGTEKLLPPGTSIVEVYDEMKHELLILGEPGAGKSTQLLDLAQKLVERAEQDQTHPLPIILPLSSWAIKRLLLQDWITEQMSEIYDVPRTLSIQWMEERGILPLLDGLDEMEETVRAACIEAINTYHRDHLAKLVVCSRTAEYKAASKRRHLALQGAVVVQPLTHEQVDAYLIQAGEPLTVLRRALQKNSALYESSTTPLMLNILILAYQRSSMPDLSNRESPLVQQVWDDYVQRMVERKGNSRRYPLKHTRLWLHWLAQQMREQNQTVFYLEHLQPGWLPAQQQRVYTWAAMRIPALLIGILAGFFIMLEFVGVLPPWLLLQYGVLGGLLGGLWSGDAGKGTMSAQSKKRWRQIWEKRMTVSVFVGFLTACCFAPGLNEGYTPNDWLHNSLIFGSMFGLSSLLLQNFLIRVSSAPFPVYTIPNHPPQRWQRLVALLQTIHGQRALLVAIIGLSLGLLYGLLNSPGLTLSFGLINGLLYGLISVLVSLIFRAQTGNIHLRERLKWTRATLRRSLLMFNHLRITFLLTFSVLFIAGSFFILFPTLGLKFGLIYGPGYGLTMGLSYWLWFGLFQGIAPERIEDQDRRVPNQGIRQSLYNSAIMGVSSGAIIGGVTVLSNWLLYWLGNWLLGSWSDSGLSYWLLCGLLAAVCGGLLACMVMGGLATLQHYVIRLLLWRSRTFPMLAPRFLDDATTRFLLRRVGGGYQFAHRLLLDHLADAPMPDTEQLAEVPTADSEPSSL